MTRALVAGIGNIFLGDDGFGCEVADRLSRKQVPEDTRVADYGTSGMHLAYDLLEGFDLLIMVDALPGNEPPGTVEVLRVESTDLEEGGQLDAHGMTPTTVLSTLEALGGTLPLTYVVGCVPESVVESMGLTTRVAAAVDDALGEVHALLAQHPAPTGAGIGRPSTAGEELT